MQRGLNSLRNLCEAKASFGPSTLDRGLDVGKVLTALDAGFRWFPSPAKDPSAKTDLETSH